MDHSTQEINQKPSIPESTYPLSGIVSWAVKGVLYKVFIGLVLMVSAGRWDWWAGWIYVLIFLLFDVVTALAVLPQNPGLLIERANRQPGIRNWDRVIMPLAAGLLPLISYLMAGLDDRLGWGSVVCLPGQITAALVTVAGYGLVVWSMSANAFFSSVMRIQSERGHTVQTGGPYQWIRHPGYLGAVFFSVSVPVLLGSWWAMIPGGIASALLILRTVLEDQALQRDLPGYQDYSQKVTAKLIPGIW